MFILQKSGLRLRAIQLTTDIDNLSLLSNDIEVAQLMDLRFPTPRSESGVREDWKAIEDRTDMFCMIETTAKDPEFVGITGLWKGKNPGLKDTGFGVGLVKKFWNKGYGSEITRFMVDYAFRHLNMHRVSLGVFGGNDRALAVYQKCGFVLECRKRRAYWQNGGWKDMVLMGILVEDWKEYQDSQKNLEK